MAKSFKEDHNYNQIKKLSTYYLVAFIFVAISLFYWGLIKADSILTRDDNPRLVESELRIQRGTIFDRNGKILAETIGSPDRPDRYYPLSNQSPAIGYFSFLHGTAGVEAGFDPHLRGDNDNDWEKLRKEILHLPQVGQDVKLSLDADIQQDAVAALDNHNGALILLEVAKDRSVPALVRAMASIPTYDPNKLDEQFDTLGADINGPLLNRVTQGQYQPGLLVQPLIIAYAVEHGLIQIDGEVINPDRSVMVNGSITHCATPPPDPATWKDVLQNRCPGPVQDLSELLGRDGLNEVYSFFELNRDPNLEISTETTNDNSLEDPRQAAIGQENLSITPLKVALAYASIINNGVIPQLQMVTDLEGNDGYWETIAQETTLNLSVSARTASIIKNSLKKDRGIVEFYPLVISGPEGGTNAWYIGSIENNTAQYLVILVLEGSDREDLAQAAGRKVLSAIEAEDNQ